MLFQNLFNTSGGESGGSINLAGENYLSFNSVTNTLTANPINLGTSNVTGTLSLNNLETSTGGKVLISGVTPSWTAFPTIGGITLDNQNSAGGAGTLGILKFSSVLADSNYANFGGSGRNIGVTNASALFTSYGVDWESATLSNVYVYSAGSTAAITSELSSSGLVIKTAPGGTISTTATMTDRFSIGINGVVNVLTNIASSSSSTGSLVVAGGLGVAGNINAAGTLTASNISGTNTGNVSYSGENYLTFNAGTQALTGNAINLNSTNVTNTLPANKGGSGNATYATGDLLVATGATTLSRLPLGTLSQLLQSNGTNLIWTGFPSVENFYINNAGTNLTSTNAGLYVNPGSPNSDGNYINFSGGRNIGITSAGASFLSFNLDYDATANAYLYNAGSTFSITQEISASGLVYKYSAGGTAGATATLSNGLAMDTSGNISATNLSGTNTGNVTLTGETYLTIAGQAITVSSVNVSGTQITGILKAASFPALSGVITTSAGSLTTSFAASTGLGTYVIGDVLYASSTTQLSRLPIGAVTQVLVSGGSAPAWTSNLTINSAFITNGGVNLAGTAAALYVNPGSVGSDGNYINFSNDGKNIGITNTGSLFYSYNLNYDATANVYKYGVGSAFGITAEIGSTGFALKYSAGGTSGATATLTTGLAMSTSGNISANNLSGTNSGDVTLSGENYLTIAGQVITANSVTLSGTNVTGVLPLSKGGSNANLTAVGGGIVYSTSVAFAITAVGSSGQFLQSAATGTPIWSSTLSTTILGNIPKHNVIILTPASVSPYTPSAGCTSFDVKLWGPGGGGGGVAGAASSAAGASGGNAGAYCFQQYTTVSGTYSFVVGSGGNGGTAGANAGSNGSAATTFNSSAQSAGAGQGGTAATAGTTLAIAGASSTLATASGGLINFSGSVGDAGLTFSGSLALGGAGGFGVESSRSRQALNAAGNNAIGYGSGGCGAATIGATNRAGGNGADGAIEITEYFAG